MNYSKVFLIIVVGLISIGFILPVSEASPSGETVYIIEIDDESIDAGTSQYVGNAINHAEKNNSPLIIKLDTPGGLLEPTKKIVDRILDSDVMVVCWVSPDGAFAYSAGTYILMASDIAVMDNGTSIGAAEPRPSDNKTVSAMISWIRGIADTQDRPGSIAEKFVTNNKTMGPENAFRENVVDLIAANRGEVLDYLGTPQANIKRIDRGIVSDLLGFLSSPQIAILFLILGMLGLAAEVTTGGVGVPGIAGGLFLLLAFFGLRVLAISTLGFFLSVLGAVLLAMEVFQPGFGAFGIGGGVMLFLGILFIGEEPWVQISGTFVRAAGIGLILAFGVFVWIVRKSRGKEVKTGMESMIGERGVAIQDIDPEGVIRIRGERWAAASDEQIDKGEEVIVREIKEKSGVTTFIVERFSKD